MRAPASGAMRAKPTIPRDVDTRDEPFEQGRRSRSPFPDGSLGRELETHSGGGSREAGHGFDRPTIPPDVACPGRVAATLPENHQSRLGLLRGSRETKPGLRRREHTTPFLGLCPLPHAAPTSGAGLPWPGRDSLCQVAKPGHVEQNQRKTAGLQKNLGGGKRRYQIRRPYPEKTMQCHTGGTRARGIERIGEIDPCREILVGRDTGQKTLHEARRPCRSATDQLGETPSRYTTAQKLIDFRAAGREPPPAIAGSATALLCAPIPPRVLRHVSAPEGSRELREEVFDAKLRSGLHPIIFALSSPPGQGGSTYTNPRVPREGQPVSSNRA